MVRLTPERKALAQSNRLPEPICSGRVRGLLTAMPDFLAPARAPCYRCERVVKVFERFGKEIAQ